MMLKKSAIAAAALFAVVSAQANGIYDFGAHDAVEVSFALPGAGIVAPGAFVDLFTFALPTASTVTSTVVSLNQAGFLGITGGQYYLWSGAGNAVVPGSLFSFDGTTGSTPHALVLDAGVYAYAVTGTATNFGGYYSLISSVSAVPEPETMGLMLAGIGVLGFLAKRRKV